MKRNPKNSMDRFDRICPLCDEVFDSRNPEAVRVHDHPEPQSGPSRDHWLASRLPYKRWIVETEEGREWANRKQTSP